MDEKKQEEEWEIWRVIPKIPLSYPYIMMLLMLYFVLFLFGLELWLEAGRGEKIAYHIMNLIVRSFGAVFTIGFSLLFLGWLVFIVIQFRISWEKSRLRGWGTDRPLDRYWSLPFVPLIFLFFVVSIAGLWVELLWKSNLPNWGFVIYVGICCLAFLIWPVLGLIQAWISWRKKFFEKR